MANVAETKGQNTLGKGLIREAYIYSSLSGIRVPVVDNLLNVDIYEDIYTPYVYCDIMFVDYDAVANKFPLAGEEYFVFTFMSHGGKEVRYHFMLYKLDNAAATDTNAATGYIIRGVTLERALDSGKTVSSAYRGTHSSMAAQIFDDYMAVDAGGLSLNYEPSRGVDHFIPPQISPISAINYLRTKAVSISEVRSPFLFFRNSNGYYFQSMNGLFNVSASKPEAQVVHRYMVTSPSPMVVEEVDNTNADIIDFSIDSYYDTLQKIDLGGYNAHTFSFDLTTKWFGLRQIYNATDYNGKFQLGGANIYNRTRFMDNFNNTRCVAHYLPTDMSREFMGTTKEALPDYLGEMAGYTNLVSEYNINYTIYGDSNVTAGQVMKVLVPLGRDKGAEGRAAHKSNEMFSGSFLLSNVRHSITVGETVNYYTVISGINGARDMNIEKVNANG